jgi:glycosyltransferase involved in cell wall biosynthesis
MRIAYLTRSIIPSRTANSIQVMKMCRAFAHNGHEVILFAPEHPDIEPGVNDVYQFYGVQDCFRLRRFPRAGRRLKRLINYLVALKVRLCRPDLVFAPDHSLRFSLSTIRLPVVLEAHRLILDQERKSQLSELIHSEQFKRLVVISEALRRAYQAEYNIPDSLIKLAPNGADEPADCESLILGPRTRLQVGYVGHLYPNRGMEMTSELARSCPWADFHIVGGTESDLASWRNRLAGSNNIFLHGFLPFSKAEQYRQSVDVLIAPYQRKASVVDGKEIDVTFYSPNKIFEYMAAAKAILASDLPVLREVLTHGVTAWLCPPEDLKSWVAGLTELRDNPELRNLLGLQAREKFRAQHTWRARAARILEGLR